MPHAHRNGMAVIELLVVGAIVLLFAFVLLPQWRAAPDDERLTQAEYRLATIRGAIESYRQQHDGQLPAHDERASLWASLTMNSRTSGAIDPLGHCGGYLTDVLVNPFNGSSKVGTTSEQALGPELLPAAGSVGWLYNPTTGQLFLASDPGFDL